MRKFMVTGRFEDEVYDLVGRHLGDRGWRLDERGEDCHRAGWLLDRTVICVGVYPRDGAVIVVFEGAKAW